jgi:hypothetical protein
MVELEKRVSGDWIDLKEALNDLQGLLDLLKLPLTELRAIVDRLRLSMEQGVVEFKRSTLSPILAVLETVRYKSLVMEEIAEQEKSLTALLFVVLVQRLIAMEIIPLSKQPEERKDFPVDDMQVNVILSDVNARIKSNPALRVHPAIKNILMQVQLYNKENGKLKELLPTIKPEMRAAFLRNFIAAFNAITARIRKNYLILLQEEMGAKSPEDEGFSLSLLPLKEIGPLLTNQAKELARMRSTLAHAREEKYKTREILVRLYDQRQDAIRMIEQELAVYRSICVGFPRFSQESCTLGIADGFRAEIIGILEKQIKWEEPVS